MAQGKGIEVKVTGTDEIIVRLQMLAESYPQAAAGALYEEAQPIMVEAKRRCPVSPHGGGLRASGTVHEPVIDGKQVSVELSFGDTAATYALAVHEHLSEHSPPSWVAAEESGRGVHWNAAGTGPKYLEGPFLERKNQLAVLLLARLEGWVRGIRARA